MNRTRSRILISLLIVVVIVAAWGLFGTLSRNGFFTAVHHRKGNRTAVRLDAQTAFDRFQPVLDQLIAGFGIPRVPDGAPPSSSPCYDDGDPNAHRELPPSTISNGDSVTFSPYRMRATQGFNNTPNGQIDTIMKRIHDYLQRNGWHITKYAPLPPSPPNAEAEVNASNTAGYSVSISGLRGRNNVYFILDSPCYTHPAAK